MVQNICLDDRKGTELNSGYFLESAKRIRIPLFKFDVTGLSVM